MLIWKIVLLFNWWMSFVLLVSVLVVVVNVGWLVLIGVIGFIGSIVLMVFVNVGLFECIVCVVCV